MDAKELMIGNYLCYKDYSGDIIEVDEITKDVIGGWTNGVYHDPLIQDLAPIPLTEQRLLDFGFGYWDDIDEWYSPDKSAIIRINHYTVGEKIGFFESDYGIEIKYVHQLQNLYFALTGEKLIAKSKTL